MHPCCGNLTQICNLQKRAKIGETQTADSSVAFCRPSEPSFIGKIKAHSPPPLPSPTNSPISPSFSNCFPDICFFRCRLHHLNPDVTNVQSPEFQGISLSSAPPKSPALEPTMVPLSACWQDYVPVEQATSSCDANHFFFFPFLTLFRLFIYIIFQTLILGRMRRPQFDNARLQGSEKHDHGRGF